MSLQVRVKQASLKPIGDSLLDSAVDAAQEALRGAWSHSKTSPSQRGELLYRLADLLERDRDMLARLESLDVGKPYAESFNFDLPMAINTYRYYAVSSLGSKHRVGVLLTRQRVGVLLTRHRDGPISTVASRSQSQGTSLHTHDMNRWA
jgi:acyl-CoA reductase-like NAD-dependent aldehyde dehydrogenase